MTVLTWCGEGGWVSCRALSGLGVYRGFPGAMPRAITFWPRWGVWKSGREPLARLAKSDGLWRRGACEERAGCAVWRGGKLKIGNSE